LKISRGRWPLNFPGILILSGKAGGMRISRLSCLRPATRSHRDGAIRNSRPSTTIIADVNSRKVSAENRPPALRQLAYLLCGNRADLARRLRHPAVSIRDGWVIGRASVKRGNVSYGIGPRWNLLTGGVDTTFLGVASAINMSGWIVGQGPLGAEFVTGSAVVPLPKLGGSARSSVLPVTFSDDGVTIAGRAPLAGSDRVAVVWACR